MADYVIEKVVATGYDETIERVKEALAGEGFGVVSEIDVHEAFKKKLGVDFMRYKILGACHPPSAHQALVAEEAMGVLMPCNVVVHETEGGTSVKAVRPTMSLSVSGRQDLAHIGIEVEARLARVVESL